LRAAAQPSSITRSNGPLPLRRPVGLISGPAQARISKVTIARRSSSSQSGVCAGVSSGGLSPASSRIAGNASWRGAGGVTRSSHQITGRPARASSSQG